MGDNRIIGEVFYIYLVFNLLHYFLSVFWIRIRMDPELLPGSGLGCPNFALNKVSLQSET